MTSATNTQWKINQEVVVAPRTWPGINKPGGHGKIVDIHYSSVGIVDSLDVKYTLGGGTDTHLETDLVKPHVELDRGRRSRRGRDFLTVEAPAPAANNSNKSKSREKSVDKKELDNKENDKPKMSKKKQSKVVSEEEEGSSDALLQKKRKKQPKKKPSSGIDTSPPVVKNATANKKKQRTDNQNEKAKATTRKPQFKPEEIKKPPRSSIPRYVDTTNTAISKTVSPLTDGTGGDSASGFFQLCAISDADTCSASQSSSNQPNKAYRTTPSSLKMAPTNSGGKPVTAAPVERKTLKHIYDGQVQDATNYVNNLVGGGANRTKPAPKPEVPRYVKPEKTAEQRLEEERGHEFGQHFSLLMQRNDYSISEEDLLEAINRSVPSSKTRPFTKAEAERYVSQLCAQDKIMKSDGQLFGI